MSTRPFAYNPGGNISGTQQFGSLTVGTPISGFELQSVKFWNGPEEQSNAIIVAYPDPEATHMGADGTPAQIGFLRFNTSLAFKLWAETEAESSFANEASAYNYLISNGYWTNWAEVFGTPNPTATPGENGGGSGSWYFYSDVGQLNANPPLQDGNAIFLIRDNEPNSNPRETFNPNKSSGTNEIYFNLSDSTGTDYTTQFAALQTNGGTISITQGSNTVTYTSATPGAFFVMSQEGFFMIQTGSTTQTVTSASAFFYGDPISITFS